VNATKIVQDLLEAGENPRDFLTRNADVHVPTENPTHRFHFNIGEGSYRCGIAFEIDAGSRREAVVYANQLLRKFFYERPGNSGSLDINGGPLNNFRVYVDDDLVVTEQDIVDEYAIT
jgi:hypothetical protein